MTVSADAGAAAPRSDRLDLAAPGTDTLSATPEAHIRRAYDAVKAASDAGRFTTIAKSSGPRSTELVRVPVR
jgi:hypothetical protein